MKDRNVKILEILAAQKSIKINFLAELLNVSQSTLRKDLDNLEKRGIIRRTHGYATFDGAVATGKRMAVNYTIKRKIAKAAAQIVEEGETVMLESGSCCAMLAEELALAQKNIKIITNSFFIANHVYRQNIQITLLGGKLQPEEQVLVGHITAKCSEAVSSKKIFIGTDGFLPGYGFTGGDPLHAETVTELVKRADDVFVLTDSAKFFQRGKYNLIHFNRVSGVFTDDSISKEAESDLIKNNIKLHKVPAADEKIMWRKFPGQPPVLYSENK